MQVQKSFQNQHSCLYLVPTPIGNLKDMTYRAVEVLKEVDLILAEDTRHSHYLLSYYQIETPVQSFHEHSSQEKVAAYVEQIKSGQTLALISDAGMPLINDPGHPLVQALLEQGLQVIALPGATAALTALVASGLPANQFTYYGFFPRKKSDQLQLLKELRGKKQSLIFYESPYRLKTTLKIMASQWPSDTAIVIGRELTKQFEEYLRGSLSEVQAYVAGQTIKGEIVLMVHLEEERICQAEELGSEDYKMKVQALMVEKDLPAKAAIKEVANQYQVDKRRVYAAYHELD